ncbi:YceD family protein [uncultured Thiohalocapsa sp.]|uniref:YceD family protein n=1 Tax=uncultured Thiohalocapsa sp. TaxID=768990 RepID=UPI0025F30F78|nr:YceD family protein [uncultured Thiohalocapsa sp.]
MCDALPQSVDPRRLAELQRELAGTLPLSRLPRLAQLVLSDPTAEPGCAAYRLAFRRDASGRDLVQGEVTATLRLRCERCNGVLELPVASTFTLAVVDGLDEAARLPEDYEPLLPEEATLDPATLVEDELLLAVPTVPRHPVGACSAPAYTEPEGDASPASGEPSPFAALEGLKRYH